jgi:tripartite ATP-independent transporter DctP family solute receptor
MKRRSSPIAVACLVGSLVLAGGSVASAATAQKFHLKLSHQMAPTHTLNETANKFAELVKEKTQGNVDVEVFPSASLGSERENVEALKTGTLDLGIIAVEFYPSYVKESAVLILPYLYKDYDHLSRVLASDVGKDVAAMILDKTNIRPLTYLTMAFRQMFTNREVRNAADLKGLKMRVPESPLYVAAFKQLGAAPTPIAWGEVYTALQTGVVSGVENTPEAVQTTSLDQVTKFMNFSNHMTSSSTISMSESVFKKLPKEYQQAVLSAAAEAAKFNHGLTVSRDQEYRAKLGKTLKVVQPDVESFRKAIRYDQIDLVSSDKAKELITKLMAIK